MSWLRSLRVRITALAVVALAAVLLLVGVALSRTLEDQLLRSVDRSLEQDLDEVLDGRVDGPRGFPGRNRRDRQGGAGAPVLRLRALAESVSTTRTAAALFTPDGELLTASRSMQGVMLDAGDDRLSGQSGRSEAATLSATYVGAATDLDEPGDGDDAAVAVEQSGELRVRSLQVDGGHTLVVAQGLSTVDEALSGFRSRMALGAFPLLGLLGLMIWTLVGRALNPVETIRREVDEIGDLGLDRRVSVPTGSYELERLATTMNHMLDRVDTSVAGQRRFVADASHELRSPLTAIRSTLEVNLAHPEEVDWVASAEAMDTDAIRMQRLLEDLLALARSDAGQAPTHRELVDLDDLVLGEVERLRAQHPTLQLDLSGVSAAQVMGDPSELGRVARNLLENAARHADRVVSVRVEERDEAGGRARLEVADDGPGVPPEQAEEIFKRFVRLDEARARTDGGSGLGLAIVAEIVERHQGEVSVHPNHPTGARFHVVFS